MKNSLISAAMLATLAVLGLCPDRAAAQLRIVTYNSSGVHPLTQPTAQTDDLTVLKTIIQGIGAESVNGLTKPIDVITLQEQSTNNSSGDTQAILNQFNAIYGAGVYARSMATNSGDTHQTIIYNTHTVQLVGATNVGDVGEFQIGTTSTTGAPRAPMRFQLRPVGYDSSSDIYIYSSHYKANDSDPGDDPGRRNVEAQEIRADADSLGAGKNIIYAGDFNVYTSTEPMWTTLTAAGNGQASDPANRVGSWDNNSSFADIHTQSPVAASNAYYNGQVGGGMDDRFDFQLVSSAMKDGTGLSYIGGSYHTFGNNGTTFNKSVNDPANTVGIKTMSFNGINMLDALAEGSDHLPVVAQYQFPAKMTTSLAAVPAKVIIGASLTTQLTVTNSAGHNTALNNESGNELVAAAIGADKLNYTVTASGDASGSTTGTGLPAASQAASSNVHTITLSTSTTGNKSGTVMVTPTSQGVPSTAALPTITYQVLAHANASFTTPADTNTLTVDLGSFPINSGVHLLPEQIDNLMSGTTPTAPLDLVSVNGSGTALSLTALSTDLTSFTQLQPNSSRNFNAKISTTTLGNFSATYTLNLSDDATLLGATTQSLTVQLTGTVTHIRGDLTLDNQITNADIQELMVALTNMDDYQHNVSHLSDTELKDVADVNHDGKINNLDVQSLISLVASGASGGATPGGGPALNGGSESAGNAVTAVPEPSSLVLFGLGFALLMCRRRFV